MENLAQVISPYDAATKEYVDDLAPVWKSGLTFAAKDWCVHNGELWHNTSGTASTGVEPGTDYNVWNVTYSNKNLLDNPWFTVNQRGQTSYTSGYTVDRWKLHQNGGSVNITPNGYNVVVNGGSAFEVRQILSEETAKSIEGKLCTISVLRENGDICSYSWIKGRGSPSVDIVGTLYASYTFSSSGKENIIIRSHGNAAVSGTIRAMKLELGSVSTLANDTIPDYGTEFVKCVTSTVDPSDTYANKRLLTSVDMHTVSLSGTFDSSYGYATIDGVKYTSADSYNIILGRKVLITIGSGTSSARSNCKVSLNDTTVMSGAGTYEYTVTGDCAITFTRNGSLTRYWTANIVTS